MNLFIKRIVVLQLCDVGGAQTPPWHSSSSSTKDDDQSPFRTYHNVQLMRGGREVIHVGIVRRVVLVALLLRGGGRPR